jgi:4a-hydroxytetrahydrobiopterin dehydratase
MADRGKLSEDVITEFLAKHPGWESRDGALAKTFTFSDYSACVGFAVRIALAAERRDHHPDIGLSWGRVSVVWTTHDSGGVTPLDLELAKRTDELSAG